MKRPARHSRRRTAILWSGLWGHLTLLSESAALAASTGAGCTLLPATPHPSHAVVLVVLTPGYAPEAYGALRAALERRGLAAWALYCPPPTPSPDVLAREALPYALKRSGARALVGHGLGGTLVAQALAEGHVHPDAVALLGAPLQGDPATAPALLRYLALLPLPAAPTSLSDWLAAPWHDHTTAEVLLGQPLPALEPTSPSWLAALQDWGSVPWQIDLRSTAVPTWAGSGGLDNLAPAEVMRSALPPGSFHRYGYLSLDDHDPDSAELLHHDAALRDMARWLRRML